MTPYIFTKEDTKLLKGGGIILMLAHHLWAFPERLISDLPLTSMTPFGMQIAMEKYVCRYLCFWEDMVPIYCISRKNLTI